MFGQFYLGATTVYLSDFQTYVLYISAYVKRALEIAYVLSAVYIVIKYKKESREPRFLRLSAFIVPFALGALIRDYVPIFLAAGILLTYITVVKRDRYLDPDTGFYNRNFLDFLKTYRDRKQYYGGCAIRIDASEHKNEMAAILKELSPVGSTQFALENDTFLLMTESMRPSAQKLLVMTFSEAAEESDTPFSPKITSMTLPELQL